MRKSNLFSLTFRKSSINLDEKIKPSTQQSEYVTFDQLSKTKYLDEKTLLTTRQKWVDEKLALNKKIKVTRKTLLTT